MEKIGQGNDSWDTALFPRAVVRKQFNAMEQILKYKRTMNQIIET